MWTHYEQIASTRNGLQHGRLCERFNLLILYIPVDLSMQEVHSLRQLVVNYSELNTVLPCFTVFTCFYLEFGSLCFQDFTNGKSKEVPAPDPLLAERAFAVFPLVPCDTKSGWSDGCGHFSGVILGFLSTTVKAFWPERPRSCCWAAGIETVVVRWHTRLITGSFSIQLICNMSTDVIYKNNICYIMSWPDQNSPPSFHGCFHQELLLALPMLQRRPKMEPTKAHLQLPETMEKEEALVISPTSLSLKVFFSPTKLYALNHDIYIISIYIWYIMIHR